MIAKAPITPSNENEASNTSRYRKLMTLPFFMAVVTSSPSSSSSNKAAKLSTITNKITPEIPAIKALNRIASGNQCWPANNTPKAKIISIDSNLPKSDNFLSR